MGARFGPADTQHGDWHGTVSLDDPIDEVGVIERIAGLDPDQWSVCGIHIRSAAGRGVRASVLAARRDVISGFDDWSRVARAHSGAVPVTEFLLPDGTAIALLQSFRHTSIHATRGPAIEDQGFDLEIVDVVEPPTDPVAD